jgi:Flp pilus assembly CpaF family ATPase
MGLMMFGDEPAAGTAEAAVEALNAPPAPEPTRPTRSRGLPTLPVDAPAAPEPAVVAAVEPAVAETVEPPAPTVPATVPAAAPVTAPAAPVAPVLTDEDKAAWEGLKDRLFDSECTQISILPTPPAHGTPYVVSVNIDTRNYSEPNIVFTSEESLRRVIDTYILPHSNVDMAPGAALPPIVPGTLTYSETFDGITETVRARIQVRTPPAQYRTGLIISKLPHTELDLEYMVTESGSLNVDMAYFLAAAVEAKASIVFSGAPGAGKTCLLNACTYQINEQEKVAVLQDVDELPLEHIIVQDKMFTHRAHARSRSLVSDGSMSALIEDAKLSRPDRIITGECRDGAMLDHLEAASIFGGCLTTIHANSAEQALDNAYFFANKHPHAPKNEQRVWEMIAAGIDLIVHLGVVDGRRTVMEIAEVSSNIAGSGKPALNVLWEWDTASNAWVKGPVGPSEHLRDLFAAHGQRDTWHHPVAGN